MRAACRFGRAWRYDGRESNQWGTLAEIRRGRSPVAHRARRLMRRAANTPTPQLTLSRRDEAAIRSWSRWASRVADAVHQDREGHDPAARVEAVAGEVADAGDGAGLGPAAAVGGGAVHAVGDGALLAGQGQVLDEFVAGGVARASPAAGRRPAAARRGWSGSGRSRRRRGRRSRATARRPRPPRRRRRWCRRRRAGRRAASSASRRRSCRSRRRWCRRSGQGGGADDRDLLGAGRRLRQRDLGRHVDPGGAAASGPASRRPAWPGRRRSRWSWSRR